IKKNARGESRRSREIEARAEQKGAKGRSPRGLELQSVFLFTPHYLLTVHPANERQYKAVGGDSDISTQAGSLETFELLARMAQPGTGWTGGGSGCKREPGGVPAGGMGFQGWSRWGGWVETDKINNE
ncbi:hypothetical protein K0M31_015753, partial [Melipona bicolor]